MLFTAGVLLAADPPIPKVAVIIPIVWAVIGGSAAFLLGIRPDLELFVAAGFMGLYSLKPRTLTR